MKIYVLIAVTAFSLGVKGLRCWTCDNVRTDRECRIKGSQKSCQRNQGSCESEVRENNGVVTISKRCKQTMSCLNNQKQNVNECKPGGMNSVCRCCCSSDNCDQEAVHCKNLGRRRSRPRLEPNRCSPLETPPNGIKDCSRTIETEQNSICRFSCRSDYIMLGERLSVCRIDRRTNTARFSNTPPTCVHISEKLEKIIP